MRTYSIQPATLEELFGPNRLCWLHRSVWLPWGQAFRPAIVERVTPSRVRFKWATPGTTYGTWRSTKSWVWPRASTNPKSRVQPDKPRILST